VSRLAVTMVWQCPAQWTVQLLARTCFSYTPATVSSRVLEPRGATNLDYLTCPPSRGHYPPIYPSPSDFNLQLSLWHMITWPVRRQTYSYLSSHRTSLRMTGTKLYCLTICVWTTCPRLLSGSGTAGNRTRDLASRNPMPWPFHHRATQSQRQWRQGVE